MRLMMMTCLIGLTGLMSGCATDSGFSGGSGAERSMLHGAFNNDVPWLRTRGFPNAKKPKVYHLHPSAADQGKIYRLRDGSQQGYLRYAGNVLAEATKDGVWYGEPLAPAVASHEGKHTSLDLGGYIKESAAHDHRAFPTGGVVLSLGVEPYFAGCPYSKQLTIYDNSGYIIPLDAVPGVPLVVETLWLSGDVVGEDHDVQVELVIIPN